MSISGVTDSTNVVSLLDPGTARPSNAAPPRPANDDDTAVDASAQKATKAPVGPGIGTVIDKTA
jgi:hypothetical protein